MLEPNPEKSVREVKIKSKKILAKFLLRYLFSETTRNILRQLGEGKTPPEVAEDVGFSKQRLHYWIKKFLKDRLIFEYCTGTPAIYELTAFGKKVLTTSERGVKEPILMESFDKKFRLLKSGFCRDCSRCCEVGCVLPKVGFTNDCIIAWKKLGDPRNWQKWGFKYCGVQVEKNEGLFPTVIIRSGELSGFSPYELVAEAGEIISLVRGKLKDLGVVLDDVGVPLHEPIFHTYTEEAAILNAQGIVYTPDGHIDDSPLHNPVEQNQRVPHEERNFSQQINYMGLPALVMDVSKRVDELSRQDGGRLAILEQKIDVFQSKVEALQKDNVEKSSKIERLTVANERLTDAVSKFMDMLQSAIGQPKASEVKDSVKVPEEVPSYVS